MGLVHCCYGADHHGIDLYLRKQQERLVPAGLAVFNAHRFDMRVPAERELAWTAVRTPGWGDDQPRVVVMDHAQALDKLKGSGKFKDEEEKLTPTQKGNKLQARAANELTARLVGRRDNQTHLFVVLRDATPSTGVNTPLVEAARDDGRLLEFSKSAFYDKAGRTAHVQRVAQGLGMLVEEDCAEVLAEQLGEADDGHQIEQELRKLQLWAASSGEDITPGVVGELCSHGPLLPRVWAKELVARPRSRRQFLQRTQRLAEQGSDLMEVLGVLLTEGRQALLFKTLEAAEASQGTVATLLGWSNPRRWFPVHRELSRTSAGYLEALMESTLQLREKVLQGGAGPTGVELRQLVVEIEGQLDPFEFRQ